MEFVFLAIVIAVALVIWIVLTKSTERGSSSGTAVDREPSSDFEIWRNVFEEEKQNLKEFDLFGTKAAIAWNDGDEEVIIVCVTAFRNQVPITEKWDHFEFNVKEKYWLGATPKGSPARIREELQVLGLI